MDLYVISGYILYLLNAFIYNPSLSLQPRGFHFCFVPLKFRISFFFPFFWKLAALYDATTSLVSYPNSIGGWSMGVLQWSLASQWEMEGIITKQTPVAVPPGHSLVSSFKPNFLPKRPGLFFKLDHHPNCSKQMQR